MIYRFSELFKWTSGKGVERREGSFPLYGSNGVIGSSDRAPYQNKIILGRVGAYCGSVMYEPGKFDATDNTLITTCDVNILDYKYASYLLRQYNLNSFAGGSAQPVITQGVLRHLKCDIPSMCVQKEVSQILSKYDALIELNNKRIKLLEQTAEEIYKEWFVRFRFPGYERVDFEDDIPRGWDLIKLEEFGINLTSGSRPKGGIDDSLTEGVPSLGAESIGELGSFDYSCVKYVPFEYAEKMKSGKSGANDILIYKDGAYIGKTTMFKNNFPFEKYTVNEHVFIVYSKDGDYQNYLYFTLHQRSYFDLMQTLNKNAAQPGLSKPDINRIKIRRPESSVVRQFNKLVNPILNSVFLLAKENQNLAKQRDYLLPRLMSGKIEV